ncbi:MAG: hypothetical protein WAN09_17510, partial [Candidatus Korobacteraceae bacterium]
KIYSYNDHCSAPFSRALLVGSAPPTLLGCGSRHCHGINSASNVLGEVATLLWLLIMGAKEKRSAAVAA